MISVSPPVIGECRNLLEALNAATGKNILGEGPKQLSESLEALIIKIRADLTRKANEETDYTQEQIRWFVLRHSDESMELSEKE